MKRYIALLFILLASCNISKHSYSDGPKWIPTDFNPSRYVLLVEKYPRKEKWNDAMKEYLDKHYVGQYEIVDEKTILSNNSKYADEKYKYAVMWREVGSTSSSNRTTYTPGGAMTNYYSDPRLDINGYFRDRSNGKDYPETKRYNNYGWQGFVPFFNTITKQSK